MIKNKTILTAMLSVASSLSMLQAQSLRNESYTYIINTDSIQTANESRDPVVVISQEQYDALLSRIERLEQKEMETPDAYTGATVLPSDKDSAKTKKTQNFYSSAEDEPFEKFRFGGYGELLFQYMDYSPNRLSGSGKGAAYNPRAEVSMPRFVLAFDYKFGKGWELGAEIEFEYGGTGAGVEAEYGEGIEYEYEFEKGGEVALEQFHITKTFNRYARLRMGHIIVPVGITNAHHEPINFFGTTRPEGESTLIPCTWHETGISFLGSAEINKHVIGYELMLVSGLDPYAFSSSNWIQDGSQKKFELTHFTNPAIAARLEYSTPFGLRIGASGYYGPRTADNTANTNTTHGYDINGAVGIASADLQYMAYNVTVRANFLYGWVQDADKINRLRPNSVLGYEGTPVASNAISYFVEAGYDIAGACGQKWSIIPFLRYEHYNSMLNPPAGTAADPRYNISLLTAGINYRPLPNLVVKADYTYRMVDWGNYRPEQTVSLGVAFVGWFISK